LPGPTQEASHETSDHARSQEAALEKEKLNMEHTESNVNPQGIMKDGSELKTWKGGTGIHDWQLQDNKH